MPTLLIPYDYAQRSFALQDLRSNHRLKPSVKVCPPCPFACGRQNSYKRRTPLAYKITQAKYKERQDIREVTGTANKKSPSLNC